MTIQKEIYLQIRIALPVAEYPNGQTRGNAFEFYKGRIFKMAYELLVY